MRKLYFFALLMGLGTFANAQSFSVTPTSHHIDSTTSDTNLVELYIHFRNMFQQDVTLGWEQTSANYPSGWTVTVCDNFLCYTLPHSGDTMMAMPQGGQSFLKVGWAPHNIDGAGTIVYHVSDVNNPIYNANVTFNFTKIAVSVTVSQPEELFSISPVPAHDVLHLSANHGQLDRGTVKMFDLRGQMLVNQSVNAVQNMNIDVADLAPGIYMVRYESKSGTLTKKVVVSH